MSGHCKRAILLAFATMPYQFVHAATASGINHNEHPFAYISQSFAPPHRLRAIGHAGGKSRPGVADEPFQENKETDNMEGQLKEAEEMPIENYYDEVNARTKFWEYFSKHIGYFWD